MSIKEAKVHNSFFWSSSDALGLRCSFFPELSFEVSCKVLPHAVIKETIVVRCIFPKTFPLNLIRSILEENGFNCTHLEPFGGWIIAPFCSKIGMCTEFKSKTYFEKKYTSVLCLLNILWLLTRLGKLRKTAIRISFANCTLEQIFLWWRYIFHGLLKICWRENWSWRKAKNKEKPISKHQQHSH